MKSSFLLVLSCLLPLVASTVTLTRTECHTKFSTKNGHITRTTHYSTKTVHKTCTQTTTPVSTYTPPATTVYKTVTATATATVTAVPETDTATITNTATETDTETETVTTTETQTLATPTVTITSTSTISASAGFTPIVSPQPRRRDERALPMDISSDEELFERSALLSRDSSLRSPPALKCKGPTKYPRKVSCDVDVTKKIKTIKYVAAKKTKTITACPKTTTGTKTNTVTATTTVIPDDVTATVTESATATVTQTETQTETQTQTYTPPTVTEQATATFYTQCGANNFLTANAEAGSLYYGSLNQGGTVVASAFDCCSLCAADPTCNGSAWYANAGYCRLLTESSGVCHKPLGEINTEQSYDPNQGTEVFSNGCGTWAIS